MSLFLSIFYISQRLTLWYFVFLYLIFLSQQVLYFLLSTLVLTLYIDVVLSLSIWTWLLFFKVTVTLFTSFIQWNPSRATPSRAATPLVRPYFQAPLYFSYISFKCQPLMNSHPTNLVRGQWFWFQPPLTSSHSAAARSGQPWNSWLIWLWAHRHTC